MRQWTIPTKLSLSVLPLAVMSLLGGVALVWALALSDPPGLSFADTWVVVVAVVLAVVAIGTLVTVYLVGRSISRGVKEVTWAARKVANRDLSELLATLRTPEADLSGLRPPLLDTDREDEVGELAESFGELHVALKETGARQMEDLRVGVSSIFVTLARRNSSLVDRQLAMLDQLEAGEEDAEILGGYYQLDHLATRMRRNAESLLVMAGSEAPRMWRKPTEMADVVRAAVGEVEEYQRIEVVALEPARLSGGAVSDIAHLFAELLENAVQFSPPSEPVRVTGLFDLSGYQLTVSDRGVGMTDARIGELNRILAKPPALGLSVEPTMGMYVVAKLAHRHGVRVELTRGVPGISAKVTVPRDHLEVVDKKEIKYWEDRPGRPYTSRAPSRPDASDFTDVPTREYVLRRAAGGAPYSEDDERVIDLTDDAETDGLPVRATGRVFSEESSGSPSAGPGETALGLKAALSAYDRGRRAAAAEEHAEPDADAAEDEVEREI